MGCTVERVVPGDESEAALARLCGRFQGHDPLTPVYVVVEATAVRSALRQRLAMRGSFASVRFGPLSALIETITRSAAQPDARRPITAAARAAAARVALRDRPGMLGRVADHPATEAALVSAYRLLRDVSEHEAASLASLSPKAADVVDLVKRMRELLQPEFYDEVDQLLRASEMLASSDPALEDLPAGVVIYLPDRRPERETNFVRLLSGATGVVVLAARGLELEGGEGGDDWPDELGADVSQVALEVESPAGGRHLGRRFERLISAPDADVEVKQAVRRLLSHAEAGGDLGRCIVSYPDGPSAGGLGKRVVTCLRSAGIECRGGPPTSLLAMPEGNSLVALVELARPARAGQELDRATVIGWLAASPLTGGHGLVRDLATVAPRGPIPVGLWDRCSRAAGVMSGLDQWRERLASYASVPERLRPGTSSEATHDLLTLVERLHSLTATASVASWAGFLAWATGAAEEILPPTPVRQDVVAAMADLGSLDQIEPLTGLSAAERIERFAAALRTALGGSDFSSRTSAVGPLVGSLSEVAGASSDLLLVLGCREGDLPGRQSDDPLLSRAEQSRVAGLGETERLADRQRRHLTTLLAASGTALASFPRLDAAAGRTNFASRWLEGDLLAGDRVEIPSYFGSLRRVAAGLGTPTDIGDLELAAIAVGAGRRRSDFIAELDGDFGRRVRAGRSRRRGGLSRFAGFVGTAGAGDVWDRYQSATSLESFARCPFTFFVDRLLRLERLDAPEAVVTVDPRERGTLIHDVLESFFAPFAAAAEVPRLDDDQKERLERLAEERFAVLESEGKAGKSIFWQPERRTIARDLQRFVAKDVKASRAASLVPVAVELDFGRDSEPVVIAAGGHEVKFRGRIDRVDRAPDGSLVVADYKSGRPDGYKDIYKRPLGRGTHLQLPIYAKAALQAEGTNGAARAEYRFVQATADYSVIPVELTEELDAELSAVLDALVSTVASGCFPPRPGPPGYLSSYEHCRYCDYDPVCAMDRAALWGRATWDPLLKAYVDLVEPMSETEEPVA
ncbi:MAG TPA: PD-(D/E)XK nuclease family protein [Acidimicrobiales bacterium]|jgi:RecB family exonuclease|nr:PD-(D/E)XK nuclease family protein [Acidimicrobiales bacterium]